MIALLLLLAAAPPAGGEPPPLDCRLANARVEAAIARKASALAGEEYCQFRRYDALDDLDGDGRNDLLVAFNVEPRAGNDHRGFLAVFLSSDPPESEPLLVSTGGRGEQDVVGVTVEGRRIRLATRTYLPSDPMCCPSGEGELVFELTGRTLTKVEARRSQRRPRGRQ